MDEGDGLTLVDTMLPGSAKQILAAAEGIGKPIVRIVLTHAHGDHVGSLDALAARLPDAEVSITARDARLLAGDKKLDLGASSRNRSWRWRPPLRECATDAALVPRNRATT